MLSRMVLGLDEHAGFVADDLITGASWDWGRDNFVQLGPAGEPVHVIAVRRH